MRLAVVLVCHDAYLPLLSEAVGAIDGQGVPFDQKILITDSCDAPDWLVGWETIRLDAANPNPCRNLGLDTVVADWVVFWDADNVMHRDYASHVRWKAKRVDDGVAVLFPNLHYFGGIEKMVSPPDWSEDSVSITNCWDTSSAWRKSALDQCRWDDESLCHDDWGLALKLMREGWRGERLNTHVNMRHHNVGGSERRSIEGWENVDNRRAEMLWKIRSMGVCTVFSREENMDRYFKQLETLDLPPLRSLYILNNTGSDECHKRLLAHTAALEGWQSITLIKQGAPVPANREIDKEHHLRLKNISVLTNLLWRRVTEDILFSIDDDCFAVEPDAAKKLHYHLRTKESAVSGAGYKSKKARNSLVATYGLNSYGAPIKDDFDKVALVGSVGAGFTMYLRAKLKYAFPVRPFDKNANFAGHDFNICYLLRQKGETVTLDATVKVDHV